jgi:hypothetical protein
MPFCSENCVSVLIQVYQCAAINAYMYMPRHMCIQATGMASLGHDVHSGFLQCMM